MAASSSPVVPDPLSVTVRQNIRANVERILTLQMGKDPINEVIMPMFAQFHRVSSEPALEEMKVSIGEQVKIHVMGLAEKVSAVVDPLDCLRAYGQAWNRFKVSCICFEASLKKLFSRAVSVSDKKMVDPPKPIRIFCYAYWIDALLIPLKDRIHPALFELITQQRNGGMNGFEDVRFTIDSYRELDPKLEVYTKEFEESFLEQTRTYYHTAAAKSLAVDGTNGYLDFCERVLNLETKLSTQYLATRTYQPHQDTVNQAIILDHMETMTGLLNTIFDRIGNSELDQSMLMLSLRRLHMVFSRIDKMADLLTLFEAQVDRVIQRKFELLVPIGSSPDREVLRKFPTTYCQAFLTEYWNFVGIIEECFQGSAHFISVLDKSAKMSLNNNSIHKPGDHREPSPTFVARYADAILTDKTLSISELKTNRLMLVGIKLMCSFLISKDWFQVQYKRLFSVRLLTNTRANADAEIFLIQLFRTTLSVQFSQELLVMIRDMEIWQRNRPAYFAGFVEKSLPALQAPTVFRRGKSMSDGSMGLEPLILTAASWPLDNWDKTVTMTLPVAIETVSAGFIAHFAAHNDNKQVSWIHERSMIQIEYEVGGKKYTLTMNHFQIAVMFALLNQEMLFDQLYEATEMATEWLNATMQSVLKAGLVQQNPKTKQYRLNPKCAFEKRLLNITIPGVWTRPKLQNPDDIGAEIEEQRNINTQAAIVRIMKARRVLHQTELLDLVQKQTARYFPQTADRVKKQIEKLMNGTEIMLARLDNDPNTYKYVTGQDTE